MTVTVLTPAESRDLTALETLKLQLDITSNEEDEKLKIWIHQASVAIEDFCCRVFAQEFVRESVRLDTYGAGQFIYLSRRPIVEITSITENGTALVVDTDYEVETDSGLLWRMSNNYRTCWTGASRVIVEYIGGYSLLDELPYPIERACIHLVKNYRAMNMRDPLLRSEEIPGVIRYDYQVTNPAGQDGGMPPDVTSLISPYRLMSM